MRHQSSGIRGVDPLASSFSVTPRCPCPAKKLKHLFAMCHTGWSPRLFSCGEKNNSWNSGWDLRLLLLWGMAEGENELNMSRRQIGKAEHFQSQTKQTLQLGEMALYFCHIQYMNGSPLLPLLVEFFSAHDEPFENSLPNDFWHCCWVGLLWKQTLAEIWTASPNVSLKSLVKFLFHESFQEQWWTTSLCYGYILQHACWILLVSPSFGTHSNQLIELLQTCDAQILITRTRGRISAHASSRYKQNKFTSEFSPRLQSWILGSRNINELFPWQKTWSLPMNGRFPLKFLMSMEWHGRSLIGTLNCMTEDHGT